MSAAACPCGASHETDAPGSRYFVSVIDGPRRAAAAGPYETHAAALADVEEVRALAEEIDPWAFFYAWGTCRADADAAPEKGSLTEALARKRAAS